MKELYKALSDRAIEIYEISQHEIESIAEAYHKAKLEASPPVEVEPVYEVAINGAWNDTTLAEYVKHIGIKRTVYTSPPDTEAKLKRAVEVLREAKYNLNRQDGMPLDIIADRVNKIVNSALKDIGEIK